MTTFLKNSQENFKISSTFSQNVTKIYSSGTRGLEFWARAWSGFAIFPIFWAWLDCQNSDFRPFRSQPNTNLQWHALSFMPWCTVNCDPCTWIIHLLQIIDYHLQMRVLSLCLVNDDTQLCWKLHKHSTFQCYDAILIKQHYQWSSVFTLTISQFPKTYHFSSEM